MLRWPYESVEAFTARPAMSGIPFLGPWATAWTSRRSMPTAKSFICFEPMAGITNAINLAHKGLYRELQSVPPGGTWSEGFWVKASGF